MEQDDRWKDNVTIVCIKLQHLNEQKSMTCFVQKCYAMDLSCCIAVRLVMPNDNHCCLKECLSLFTI